MARMEVTVERSFDPCTFAQEILRPAREALGERGDLAERVQAGFAALETEIRQGLERIRDREDFAVRESLRAEFAGFVRAKQEAILKLIPTAGGQREDAKFLLFEALRATSAVAMAYL